MTSPYWHAAGVGLTTWAIYLVFRAYTRAREGSLPPGPKGLPLIGNLYDVPKTEQWLAFMQMSRTYDSDLISLNLMGETVIVLNSLAAADDLLEHKSAISSDRPPFPMLTELMGFDWHLAFMRYGPTWIGKYLSPPSFTPSEVLLHRPIELQAARVLLDRLLNSPEKFEKHLRHMAGMIILSTAYGIDVQPEDDPHIAVSERALHAMACAGNRGTFLVDSLPFLKYVPYFFPGAGFKTKARNWKKIVSLMPQVPFNFVKESLAAGTARSSIASRFLEEAYENPSTDQKEQENILNSGDVAAGADTTVSELETFVLAMTTYPEVQKKAQKELDEVLQHTRLPSFDDSFPYVEAIVRECLRWRPVLPLGVSHAATETSTYKGYVIPAGAVIIPNTWAILRDENTFGPHTDTFNPERWLTETGQINTTMRGPEAAFGFGRRICAGKDMAQWSMWITVASILATFNITKSLNQEGAPIEPSGEFTTGFLIFPVPHKCDILPRSEAARAMIEAALHV
ncbi:cytochrome P450 [Mycena metata]|uniref:Cytochrome P450 n=1 Tax=Mycena metata TaxID=1033252 RepID=A0AAD7HWK8_9AGAR|nr:cytochrome P450 [Mycena metata]